MKTYMILFGIGLAVLVAVLCAANSVKVTPRNIQAEVEAAMR